ncbi:hypothetical protein HaLaN_23909 [Haematococcus lacustris]|uniref:Uncharacterized protein n=1 Tax=Haematococcus lacustris TaxID=44745 RepID=A0A699ZU10_HAELA|nr:hypothetical protein HaLaN_23909 [Haematococcus lacustris]
MGSGGWAVDMEWSPALSSPGKHEPEQGWVPGPGLHPLAPQARHAAAALPPAYPPGGANLMLPLTAQVPVPPPANAHFYLPQSARAAYSPWQQLPVPSPSPRQASARLPWHSPAAAAHVPPHISHSRLLQRQQGPRQSPLLEEVGPHQTAAAATFPPVSLPMLAALLEATSQQPHLVSTPRQQLSWPGTLPVAGQVAEGLEHQGALGGTEAGVPETACAGLRRSASVDVGSILVASHPLAVFTRLRDCGSPASALTASRALWGKQACLPASPDPQQLYRQGTSQLGWNSQGVISGQPVRKRVQ